MSEATTIMKVVSFFGICALFISLLVTDARLPSTITSWDTLTTTVTAGINFPTFSNPFQEEFLYGTLKPIANGFLVPDVGLLFGCTLASFYSCLKSNDGDTSYWISNATAGDISTVDTGGLSGIETVTRIVINVYCRATGTSALPFRITVITGASYFLLPDVNQPLFCPASASYTRISIALPNTNPETNLVWDWVFIKTNWEFGIVSSDGSGNAIRFTYMEAFVYVSTAPKCTAVSWWDDQACQIGRLVNTIITGFQFIFNTISFVILSVIAVTVFMVQVVFAVFTGLIGTAQFFLAFPGAPVPVQAFIASVFIGFITFVIYLTAKLISGAGV